VLESFLANRLKFTKLEKYQHILHKCGRGIFVRFVGVTVGVATWVNKLALRLCL